MDRIRRSIEALRTLARHPNASDVGLLKAEQEIKDCLRTLSSSEKENAVEQLRDYARAAIAQQPAEARFWEGVIDYLTFRAR